VLEFLNSHYWEVRHGDIEWIKREIKGKLGSAKLANRIAKFQFFSKFEFQSLKMRVEARYSSN